MFILYIYSERIYLPIFILDLEKLKFKRNLLLFIGYKI
jgi:hypothetical protein